ncbi:MAG: hypothetical protein ABI333_20110 [bacterium]
MRKFRIGVVFAAPLLLSLGGCDRRAVGGDVDAQVVADTGPWIDDALVPDAGGDQSCAPQQAYEDPNVDCDGCSYCDDRTPYRWAGDRCVFEPICCACAGADCGARFETYDLCGETHTHCMQTVEVPRHPEARLIWQAPGGFAGHGPALMVDGYGRLRLWVFAQYGLEWEVENHDFEEQLGPEAANELFDLLNEVDGSALPHPPQVTWDCYPVFRYLPCDACEEWRLDYASALDLLPEFQEIYDWLALRLCRASRMQEARQLLPSTYCL